MYQYALGLIETRGLVGAIEAADAALKTAHVQFAGQERIDEGFITIKIIGETAAVRAAVDAAAQAAQRTGELVSVHVIPRPHDELVRIMPEIRSSDAGENLQSKSALRTETDAHVAEYKEQLDRLTVHQLRTLARTIKNLSIQGRQISMANKKQLIDELLRARFG